MYKAFAIFSFSRGRRHAEAVVFCRDDLDSIACRIGSRLGGIALPGLYEGGRRLLAVAIDRDLARQINERHSEGEVDDLLRLALSHPDFDAPYAGNRRESFSLFETSDEAAAAILRRRDETLAEVMASAGKSR